jgi:3-methyladenine DNA glycosylase AlkC
MGNPNQLPKKQYEFSAVLNETAVQAVAKEIQAVWPAFEGAKFSQAAAANLEGKAIKERAQQIADQLAVYLPKKFAKAGKLLTMSLGSPLQSTTGEHVSGFRYMPYGQYISQHGLAAADLPIAAAFMYAMTQRFTAEFAIRPFLKKYPQEMLGYLQAWVQDESEHVRRLVSEGTRPRLPWAERVKVYDADYTPIIALLEQLHADPSLYVRRSVANHLNDLTKDRPALVFETLRRWKEEQPHPELDWLIKHSLRTLIKAGHPDALALIGYGQAPSIRLENFQVQYPQLPLGQQQEFSFELVSTSAEPQDLLLDYTVYFTKANGQQKPKVFKLNTFTLNPKERVQFQKKHWFKHFSTRRLYPGTHRIQIQINGQPQAAISFELLFEEA